MPIGEGAWKKQIYLKFNVKLETMYLKKKQYKLQDTPFVSIFVSTYVFLPSGFALGITLTVELMSKRK